MVRDGWLVSTLRSYAALRLADVTPLSKVLVRAGERGRVARALDVPLGRARRDPHETLVVGAGPGEWLLVSAPNTADAVRGRLDAEAVRGRLDAEAVRGRLDADELVSVLDLTSGRAMMRLSGLASDRVLSKVCAVDLSERVTPNGAAFRSSVAKVATDVVRDDLPGSSGPLRSYLVHCERSFGQYLFDALLDAGREFGIQADGYAPDPAST